MAKEMRCVLCKEVVAPWWFSTLHPGCKVVGTAAEYPKLFAEWKARQPLPNCEHVDTESQTVRQ